MSVRLQITLSDAAVAFIDARRGTDGRGTYARKLIEVIATARSLGFEAVPQAAPPQAPGEEIGDMFEEFAAAERPEYGYTPKRHFANPLTDYDY